jgi:hypothetical protein
VRADAVALSRFYFDPNPDYGGKDHPERGGDTNGILAQGAADRREFYKHWADLTTGKTGDMVVVLPEKARFKLDPRDDGRYFAWFSPDLRDNDWQTIRTTLPFYRQVEGTLDKEGYPYLGAMWYRMEAEVPAAAAGRKVRLFLQTVSDEAWVWVNGKFVGHRPYVWAWEWPTDMLHTFPSYLDMEVSAALVPGRKNSIVIRVNTGSNALQECPGIDSRALLYAPNDAATQDATTKP